MATGAKATHICYCRLNDIVLLCGSLKRAETLKFQRLQGLQQIYRYGICTMLWAKGQKAQYYVAFKNKIIEILLKI